MESESHLGLSAQLWADENAIRWENYFVSPPEGSLVLTRELETNIRFLASEIQTPDAHHNIFYLRDGMESILLLKYAFKEGNSDFEFVDEVTEAFDYSAVEFARNDLKDSLAKAEVEDIREIIAERTALSDELLLGFVRTYMHKSIKEREDFIEPYNLVDVYPDIDEPMLSDEFLESWRSLISQALSVSEIRIQLDEKSLNQILEDAFVLTDAILTLELMKKEGVSFSETKIEQCRKTVGEDNAKLSEKLRNLAKILHIYNEQFEIDD